MKDSQTSLAVKHNEVGGARHGRCHACQLLVLHCTSGIVRCQVEGQCRPAWLRCLCICLRVAEASASVIKSAWRAPSFSTSSPLVSILLSPLSRSGEAAGLTFPSNIRLEAEKISVCVKGRDQKCMSYGYTSISVTITAGNQGKAGSQFMHRRSNSNTETTVSFNSPCSATLLRNTIHLVAVGIRTKIRINQASGLG